LLQSVLEEKLQGKQHIFSCFNFFTLVTMIGAMEDNGLLFGLIKFAGAGGSLSGVISVGVEKSSISLFSTIPVEGESTPAPKG